jgi:predicted flap endonuclease-1-like 5' DNA nuclease
VKLIPRRGGDKKGLLESAVETVGESAALWASELVEGVTEVASSVVDGVSGFVEDAMDSDIAKGARAEVEKTKSKPKRLRLLILAAIGAGAVVLWRRSRSSDAGHDHSGHDHSGDDHSSHDHSSHDHSGHDHASQAGSGPVGGDAEEAKIDLSDHAGAGASAGGSAEGSASGIRAFASTGTAASSEAADSASAETADDIERIEGIGPKFASLLKAAGYGTFAALASASDEDLRTVLTEAGQIPHASLGTWAHQAQLLEAGDETGFKDLTDRLKAGRPAQ